MRSETKNFCWGGGEWKGGKRSRCPSRKPGGLTELKGVGD